MALAEPIKKGGRYTKKEQEERKIQVYHLHFEENKSAAKIAELLNVNRNTINDDISYWHSQLAGEMKFQGLTVMDQMRTAVRQCYGWSMPYGISVNGEEDFNGIEITNDKIKTRLEMLARDLVVYGKPIREQFVTDLKGTESNTFAAHYRK